MVAFSLNCLATGFLGTWATRYVKIAGGTEGSLSRDSFREARAGQEAMVRVKGTAIIDLVKTIRSEKDRDWEQYLKPEDLEIVKGIVLPSSWYRGDSFWRISHAVTEELGEMKPEAAFAFGRLSAQSYLGVYTRLLVPGDPQASVRNCLDLWQSFYDFEGAPYRGIELETGRFRIRLLAWDYPDMTIPEMRVPYFHGLAGYFQEITERASGKRVQKSIADRGDSFEITYDWSPASP